MIAHLTIAGFAMPVTQATLRRSADSAQLTLQLVGYQSISIGAAVALSVDGVAVSGAVVEFSPADRSTSCTVSVAAASGSGVYAPQQVHYRSTGMMRGDVDFSVLPGDTHAGMAIREATHTIGAASPTFTEVRF